MSGHEGRWVDVRSRSGQDDTTHIECSCGWRSASIWSRLSVPVVQQQFREHAGVKWKSGDPCGVCGSTKTIEDDTAIGARCLSCGACDDDE